MNASVDPSGEIRGVWSVRVPSVSWRAGPLPSVGAVQVDSR